MRLDLSQEVRDYLRAYLKATYGSQRKAAQEFGIRDQHMSQILGGYVRPPQWLLVKAGLTDPLRVPQLKPIFSPKETCNCEPGQCLMAARECRDWIKRAAPPKQTKGTA